MSHKICFFFIVLLMKLNLFGVEEIFFKFNDGSSLNYPTSNVRNLTFNTNLINLNLKDGAIYSWDLSTLKYFNYMLVTDVKQISTQMMDVRLFPNPSNGIININYTLKGPEKVSVTIFDVQGKLIKQVLNNIVKTGYHSIAIDASDFQINSTNETTYFCRIQTEQYTITKPFVLYK